MSKGRIHFKSFAGLSIAAFLFACGEPESTPQEESHIEAEAVAEIPAEPDPYEGSIAFHGANLWDGDDGDDGAVLQDAVLIVRDGRIEEVLTGEAPQAAEAVDLAGSWIVPGFIDAHAHVWGDWAADEVTDTSQKLRDELALYARYGVTTVNSLGDEPVEAMAIRDAQNNASLDHARVYLAGDVVANTDPMEAAKTTAANISAGVDWIKIRVDDSLGSAQKMPWPAIEAVFQTANARDARVATHIFYMDDASRLLDLGTDMIAHSVRDQPLDDAFVQKLFESGACYVPTLTREMSTFVYATRPEFFDDPYFRKAAKKSEVDRVSDPQFMARMAASPAAAAYRKALVQAQENLRIVQGSGIPVAFGTDAGPPGRFPGYFEHVEFYLMQEAGLTPREILLSATSIAANCLGLDDVGRLVAGKWADFVVLAKNPFEDIRNTRSITGVYIAGNRVTE
jgi:imidazolonepropionase-like amidohydrolase